MKRFPLSSLLFTGLALSLCACDASTAVPDEVDERALEAAQLDRAQASNPQHRPAAGWQTECVGYHLVDLPKQIEVATEPPERNSFRQIGGGEFSPLLFVKNDGFIRSDVYDSGEATIEVTQPTTRDQFERFIPQTYKKILGDVTEPAAVGYIRDQIKTWQDIVEHLTKMKKRREADPNHKEDPVDPTPTEEDIQSFRDKITEGEAEIKALLSVPEYWWDQNSYYREGQLWLWRAPRIYRIWLNGGTFGDQVRLDATKAFWARFRVRKLGEIPDEAGFCMPYGFIEGVSPFPYQSQTTLRVKGEPGVLYTIQFAANADGRETAYGGVFAASIGGGALEGRKELVKQRKVAIGPYEGALAGWRGVPYQETKLPNGRVQVHKRTSRGEAYVDELASQGEVYSVAAGLTGLKDDLMVPTVKVELLGVAYDVDPSLKNTPV
ncbi:MAG: hypothetical protein LBI92_04110, partial [Azoarcus sp.]|nr:hypothetical protein [Azoarcus sp.]